MNTEQIYEQLKWYAIDQAYKSLYLKLTNSLDSSKETEKKLFITWLNLVYDNIIDTYIDEIKNRGTKEIYKAINLHLKEGENK